MEGDKLNPVPSTSYARDKDVKSWEEMVANLQELRDEDKLPFLREKYKMLYNGYQNFSHLLNNLNSTVATQNQTIDYLRSENAKLNAKFAKLPDQLQKFDDDMTKRKNQLEKECELARARITIMKRKLDAARTGHTEQPARMIKRMVKSDSHCSSQIRINPQYDKIVFDIGASNVQIDCSDTGITLEKVSVERKKPEIHLSEMEKQNDRWISLNEGFSESITNYVKFLDENRDTKQGEEGASSSSDED